VEPDERLRRRLREGPAARSGFALDAGGAATAGGSGTALPPLLRDRRPRRLRVAPAAAEAGCSAAAGAGTGRWRPATALRMTFAPISPSAHIAPSAVCTSTRQTTIEEGAPLTGGRFWVSVQRA
jgi:hypothetical protein